MFKSLIEYFVIGLIDNKELLTVSEIPTDDKIIIEIKVSAQDLAKVIGKEGRTFRALRSLVKSVDQSVNRDVVVDVVS